jgi:hypothetical protein
MLWLGENVTDCTKSLVFTLERYFNFLEYHFTYTFVDLLSIAGDGREIDFLFLGMVRIRLSYL